MTRLLTFVLLACVTVVANASGEADQAPSLQQFIVHLETGDNWDPAVAPGQQTNFQEHSANMQRLRAEGVIQFGARYGEYGLLIMAVDSLESATEILAQDPGVSAGIFDFRVEPISIFYPWE